MSKKYIFKYIGSKESFLATLCSFHTSDSRLYYFDDYIVEVLDEEIRFGIERAGHSGGNWFVSKFTEENNQIEFSGTIQYIGPEYYDTRTKAQKILNKIELFFFSILLFPILAIFFVISIIQWIIRKIRKLPNTKTTEDKLFDLMENRLNCQRIIDENDS